MSKETALSLCTELLEQVYSAGEFDRFQDFFSPEVLGHYQDETYYFETIVQNFKKLCAETSVRKYTVLSHLFVGDILVLQFRILIELQHNKEVSEVIRMIAYRVVENRIVEQWVMVKEGGEHYQLDTEVLNHYFQSRTLQANSENRFWRLLRDYQDLFGAKKVSLSKQEARCLYFYLRGDSYKKIAETLNRSPRTVEDYINSVKAKYGCSTREQLKKAIFPPSILAD